MKALSPHFEYKIFTKHELSDNFFDDVDLVAFPGGIGDSDSFDFLFKHNAKMIREFVSRGGKYLGICMGAYWADRTYFDMLDGVEAVQYIKRPTADIRRSYSKAAPIVWEGEPHRMFFYDGCTFIGEGKFETIAMYANGDPMAIIQGNLGLIGCHPESDIDWYNKKYLRPHWHNGQHYCLLLEFVNRLLER